MTTDLYLMFKHCVGISVKEHVVDGEVKRRDHLGGVRYQLTVQVSVKLTEMLAVEVEKRLTDDTYLCTVRYLSMTDSFTANITRITSALNHIS